MILTGLTLSKYNDFTQSMNLDRETQRFVDILETAKRKTTSGDVSMCTGASAQVTNYSVNITSSTSYQLLPNCLIGSATPVNFNTLSSISLNPASANISFNPLGSGASESCVKITNTAGGCRCIFINNRGVVAEGKSNCSTTPLCTCP